MRSVTLSAVGDVVAPRVDAQVRRGASESSNGVTARLRRFYDVPRKVGERSRVVHAEALAQVAPRPRRGPRAPCPRSPGPCARGRGRARASPRSPPRSPCAVASDVRTSSTCARAASPIRARRSGRPRAASGSGRPARAGSVGPGATRSTASSGTSRYVPVALTIDGLPRLHRADQRPAHLAPMREPQVDDDVGGREPSAEVVVGDVGGERRPVRRAERRRRPRSTS